MAIPDKITPIATPTYQNMPRPKMTAYPEEEMLALSGVQHFLFCPRQWALIHIEQQWLENQLTAEGNLIHERVHDAAFDESRGDKLTVRGMPVASATLGVRGVCDAVEFIKDQEGVPLTGREGTYLPVPVEYKHGAGAAAEADAAQLCLEALCLEEMLCCKINEGYVYHAAEHRREAVELTEELRAKVRAALTEMHRLFRRGHTPRVKKRPGCQSCSLREICLPALEKVGSASGYIQKMLREEMEAAPK